MLRIGLLILMGIGASPALAQEAEVSVENGARLAIIGGCHDCHTSGYAQSNGQVDPAASLKGDVVGFQGPWGTTYPANLRITAASRTEDDWVDFLMKLETRPPMPWFNVHHFSEAEMRSLYQYIKSLGEPGDPAPDYVPPGGTPTTPYIVFAPPQMP